MHPIYKKLNTIVNQARLNNTDPMTLRILIKEHLQNHILFAIYNSKYGTNLIFYGGTALRKIHNLDRMSEDLDFEINSKINLKEIANIITSHFKKIEFDEIGYKIQTGKIINRITFKFPILYDLGLSPMQSEKLHIKVEINPTIEKNIYKTQLTPFIENQMSAMIKHYSLPVMMAGKISACLNRVFKKGESNITIKGRDYYDLIWYMKQKINPDKKYLKKSNHLTGKVFTKLDKKISKIKSNDLLIDLQPFFTSRKYIKDWCNNFHQLYQRYREFYN